ncbi:MAG TPA: hypothetical protein VH189_07440 [Rhizomicrobium sp.]|nr:hypothetical protein [Rhizomicrobium sp.]
MKPALLSVIACAAAFAAGSSHAAEPVLRVKAKLTAFDGQVMSLEALSSPAGVLKAGEPFSVAVLPETRYVGSDKSSLAAVKPGDYAGATVTQTRGGGLRAQDVYLYAPELRGTGEGRFTESGRLIVNGTVSAVKPPVVENKQGGALTLHYRGAMLSGLGQGRTLCEGRASPPAYASALACEGDAVLDVPPGTEVSALTVGDKSLLVVGSTVTVAMTKGAGDKNVAPGVIVEKAAAAEKPAPVEKPQSGP